MTRLTSLMRDDSADLALSLYELALAERVNPPTDRDLATWETTRQGDPEGLLTRFHPHNWGKLPNVYYHGTSGDWAGLPLPTPDRPGENEPWPTALFVSPHYGYALFLGNVKRDADHKSRIRPDTRVFVGGLDESRLEQPPDSGQPKLPPTFDYPGAISWTNQRMREIGDEFDKPGGSVGIKPPFYEEYLEDESQALLFDPFAPRWFDIVLQVDMSARGIRELGRQQGYERIADLDRQAQDAADRLLDRTPLDDLRHRRWRGDLQAVADAIRRKG